MDEIKVGTMVYVWLDKLDKWSDEKFELRAIGQEAFAYSNKETILGTFEVSLDPHTPKDPWVDVIGEDEEVWLFDGRSFKIPTGGVVLLTELLDITERHRGFLHKLGDGSYRVYNSHLMWTWEGEGHYSAMRTTYYNTPTTLIGAVMQKGGE